MQQIADWLKTLGMFGSVSAAKNRFSWETETGSKRDWFEGEPTTPGGSLAPGGAWRVAVSVSGA